MNNLKNTRVKNHFNHIASHYDLYKKKNKLYYSTLKNSVAREIEKKNVRILDIGCGTGSILKFLQPKSGVGLDISHEMIAIARKKTRQNQRISFYIHDIERKPFKGKFDYIICTDVIEHVVDKEATIKHIGKSMQKNTTLILSMANPLWEPLLLVLEKLHLKMPEGPHRRISQKDLKELLNMNNLQLVKKTTAFPRISFLLLQWLALIYVYRIQKTF